MLLLVFLPSSLLGRSVLLVALVAIVGAVVVGRFMTDIKDMVAVINKDILAVVFAVVHCHATAAVHCYCSCCCCFKQPVFVNEQVKTLLLLFLLLFNHFLVNSWLLIASGSQCNYRDSSLMTV